jgi:hypothetical protein
MFPKNLYIGVTVIKDKMTALTFDGLTEHKLAVEIASLMNTKYACSDGLIVELTPYNEVER